jgi:hypothetical protein
MGYLTRKYDLCGTGNPLAAKSFSHPRGKKEGINIRIHTDRALTAKRAGVPFAIGPSNL